MCCCGKPTINGTPGYRWNDPNAPASTYPVNPPDLQDGDTLLHDEPGRCLKGLDSHSFHYRLVKNGGFRYLLVRTGAGDRRIRLSPSCDLLSFRLDSLDSTSRYVLFNVIYHATVDAARVARDAERADWQRAAAEGRIKTRKVRGQNYVKVTVESPLFQSAGVGGFFGAIAYHWNHRATFAFATGLFCAIVFLIGVMWCRASAIREQATLRALRDVAGDGDAW